MTGLQIKLLGGFKVERRGHAPADFESDKVRALLAFLAVEPDRPHRREKLAALLWPDTSDRKARTNLRRALSNLRQAIGDHDARPAYLRASRQTIEFNSNSDSWVDVTDFTERSRSGDGGSPEIEQLQRASELYQGDFLDGFSIPDSVPFEEWLTFRKQELRESALRTFHTLAGYFLETGQLDRALEFARRQTDINPYQEAGHQQLMWLLAVSGRRNQALQHFESYRAALRENLSVEPLPRTRELYERLVSGDLPEPPRTVLVLDREPRVVGKGPFRGLAPFKEEDEEVFFGRDRNIRRLLRAVGQDSRVSVLVGPSGSGKSSLLFAGLVPRLRREGGWIIAHMRPGAAPYQALVETIIRADALELSSQPGQADLDALVHFLRSGDISLAEWVHDPMKDDLDGACFLLIVDHLEELFTLTQDHEEAARYLLDVVEATEAGGGEEGDCFRVLMAIRADFVSRLLQVPGFAEVLEEGSLYLGPMTKDELQAAIEEPAVQQGAAFEPGLVDRILDDVGESPGNLAPLEFGLTLLWEDLDRGWMTHEAYERIGTIEGALANYADKVYERLDDSQKEQAQRALVQLVQPGQATADTRRVAKRDEFGDERWQVLRILADHRLIVTDRDEKGNETAEIVHEALIGGWDRLRRWMDEVRSFRLWQEDLRAAMRRWTMTDENEGALLRGAPLTQAESQLERGGEELSSEEQAFILASIRHRDEVHRRRERRRRQTILGLATGLVVTLFLTFLAAGQWQRAEREARVSTARGLARSSVASLQIDPERSILLALEAIKTTRTVDGTVLPEAEEALHRSLQGFRLRLTIVDEGEEHVFASFDPSGKRVITGGAADLPGALKVWEAESGELLSLLPGARAATRWAVGDRQASVVPADDGVALSFWDVSLGREVETTVLSPAAMPLNGNFNWDWSLNAFGLENGTVEVWDLSTRERIMTLGPSMDSSVHYVAFSPDDRLLAGLHGDGTIRVWNLHSGQLLYSFSGHDGSVMTVEFSPDGSFFVTASADETAKVWDAQTGELIVALHGHDNELRGIAISPDEKLLATAGWDRRIQVWDLPTSMSTGVGRVVFTLYGHPFAITDVDFSPDGSELVSVSRDGSIRFWEVGPSAGAEGPVFNNGGEIPPEVAATIELSTDGSRLVAANFNEAPKVWDVASGELLYTLSGHDGVVQFLDLSHDDKLIATSGGDDTVRIREASSGRSLTAIPGLGCAVCEVEFGPSGDRIAVAIDRGSAVRLLDVNSILTSESPGRDDLTILELPGNPDWIYGGFAFSPDGSQIATAVADFEVTLWDADTGEALRTLTGHKAHVYGITYSPDGSLIVTCGQDGTARVWDAETGDLRHTLAGHTGSVFRTAFTPDMSKLATGSFDGTVKLWDIATGELLVTLYGHSAAVPDVVFSPDGSRLYTGSNDGTTRTYLVKLDELMALAQSLVTRSLTEEECQDHPYLETCGRYR